jgi:hypothetical protein
MHVQITIASYFTGEAVGFQRLTIETGFGRCRGGKSLPWSAT